MLAALSVAVANSHQSCVFPMRRPDAEQISRFMHRSFQVVPSPITLGARSSLVILVAHVTGIRSGLGTGGIWTSPVASRLATFRAESSSSPTDRPFTSRCFGPHLAMTPLRLVTGMRTMPGMDLHHPVAVHFPSH